MLKLNEKFNTTLFVASFFCFTIFLFGPGRIYFPNIVEFNFTFIELFTYSLILACLLIFLITLALMPLKAYSHQIGISILFVVSLLVWFQGSILNWNYGLLDGREIDWDAYRVYGFIDSGIWIVVILAGIVKPFFIYRIARQASIFFIVIQLVSVSVAYAQAPEPNTSQRYFIDESSRFTFSREKNVILLVLDTFRTDIFQELLNEDSSNKDNFIGFTYFRNSVSGFSNTYPSIPSILTGQYYDNSIPLQQFIKKAYLSASLPYIFKKNGFQVDLFPYAYFTEKTIYFDESIASNFLMKAGKKPDLDNLTRLYKITAFRHMPQPLKKLIFDNGRLFLNKKLFDENTAENQADDMGLSLPDVKFIQDMMSQTNSGAQYSTFKFYHLNGLHEPLTLNERLEFENMQLNKDNYKRQARAILKIVRMFLDKLKEAGVYDNSLIIIVGDHGTPAFDVNVQASGYTAGSVENNFIKFEITDDTMERLKNRIPQERIDRLAGSFYNQNFPQDTLIIDLVKAGFSSKEIQIIVEYSKHIGSIKGLGLPLVLVKRINAKSELKISDAPVSLADIHGTVLAEFDMNKSASGVSMFDVGERDSRLRRFMDLTFTGTSVNRDFLPPLREYSIEGFSWLDNSWRLTGRQFNPPDE